MFVARLREVGVSPLAFPWQLGVPDVPVSSGFFPYLTVQQVKSRLYALCCVPVLRRAPARKGRGSGVLVHCSYWCFLRSAAATAPRLSVARRTAGAVLGVILYPALTQSSWFQVL